MAGPRVLITGHLSDTNIGDAAIVLGDGMVGHWAAQTLQFRGARVLLAGKHDERLSKFETRPGDRIVNITRENLLDVAKAWAPSRVQALADTVAVEMSLPANPAGHEPRTTPVSPAGHEPRTTPVSPAGQGAGAAAPSRWTRY